jgi:hypothetical protein
MSRSSAGAKFILSEIREKAAAAFLPEKAAASRVARTSS